MTDSRKRHPVRILASFLAPVIAVLALAGAVSARIDTNTELAQQAKSNGVVACDASHDLGLGIVAYLRETFAGSQRAAQLRPIVDGLAANVEDVYTTCLTKLDKPTSTTTTAHR